MENAKVKKIKCDIFDDFQTLCILSHVNSSLAEKFFLIWHFCHVDIISDIIFLFSWFFNFFFICNVIQIKV